MYPAYVLFLVLIHLKCELILLNYSKRKFSNYNVACVEDECMLM